MFCYTAKIPQTMCHSDEYQWVDQADSRKLIKQAVCLLSQWVFVAARVFSGWGGWRLLSSCRLQLLNAEPSLIAEHGL